MGLRRQAEIDLGLIMEDTTLFGWPITVTDPAGAVFPLIGRSNDIAQSVDPDTGLIVSGRLATVALRLGALTTAGAGRPVGIADPKSKPWLIGFDDINGKSYVFKVSETLPDSGIGVIVCILEDYT